MTDTTAEMPERIWAAAMYDNQAHGVWDADPAEGTPYVLASTHTRAMEALEEAEKALKEAREALEISDCPRPISGPDDMEAQACIAAGECGCCYGAALAKVPAALTLIAAAKGEQP